MSKVLVVHPFFTRLTLPHSYHDYASMQATMRIDPTKLPTRLRNDIRRIVESGVGRRGTASTMVESVSGTRFWNLRGRQLWLSLPNKEYFPKVMAEVMAFATMVPGTIEEPTNEMRHYYNRIYLNLAGDVGSKAGKEYRIALKKRKAFFEKLTEIGRDLNLIDFSALKRAGDRLLGTTPFSVNIVV